MARVAAVVAVLLFSSVSTVSAECINISLNNVLGIGDCMGEESNYCTNPGIPVTAALNKLTKCALNGIIQYGSLAGILRALEGVGQTLLNSLGIANVITSAPPSGPWSATGQTCEDPIHITTGDIGLLGQCFGELTEFCQKGEVADDTVYEQLFDALKCVLLSLSSQDLLTIALGQICTIIKGFEAVDYGVDLVSLLTSAGFGLLASLC